MHITEENCRRTFAALKADRPAASVFSHPASQPGKLDAESAAKRILEHAFASKAMPSLNVPRIDGTDSNFKSLGVETVPLTGTKVVKFRQQVKGIPVFGSLVSVELDNNNEMVSLNSNMAEPDVPSYVARISPHDALKRIAAAAGYGRELPEGIPTLNLFLDHKGKWHLAYIVEDVRSRKKGKTTVKEFPLVHDYVIDALTGALVAELPRTPTIAVGTGRGLDEFGKMKTFGIEFTGGKRAMRDARLNIETYDFGFRDPVDGRLPGELVQHPWSAAAVSAHTNAAVVATFLRDVLKRNNIDNMGGRYGLDRQLRGQAVRAAARQQHLAERTLGRHPDAVRPGAVRWQTASHWRHHSPWSRTSCFTALPATRRALSIKVRPGRSTNPILIFSARLSQITPSRILRSGTGGSATV